MYQLQEQNHFRTTLPTTFLPKTDCDLALLTKNNPRQTFPNVNNQAFNGISQVGIINCLTNRKSSSGMLRITVAKSVKKIMNKDSQNSIKKLARQKYLMKNLILQQKNTNKSQDSKQSKKQYCKTNNNQFKEKLVEYLSSCPLDTQNQECDQHQQFMFEGKVKQKMNEYNLQNGDCAVDKLIEVLMKKGKKIRAILFSNQRLLHQKQNILKKYENSIKKSFHVRYLLQNKLMNLSRQHRVCHKTLKGLNSDIIEQIQKIIEGGVKKQIEISDKEYEYESIRCGIENKIKEYKNSLLEKIKLILNNQ